MLKRSSVLGSGGCTEFFAHLSQDIHQKVAHKRSPHNADTFLFGGWSNNLEWTSNRSKAPPKWCLFSIPPPSQDCSFPLGLGSGVPLSRDLEVALYKF